MLLQYTRGRPDGTILVYSQELGSWMELHSAPAGINLIDHRIAFYSTVHDLIPMVIEADPGLDWADNLVPVDLSSIYTTDRRRLVSFSSVVETELAQRLGIDLTRKNAGQEVALLLDHIYAEGIAIHFQVPGDPSPYTWILDKGVRVSLVSDGQLDPQTDASIYQLENGDKLKIFARNGILQYIVSTHNIGQKFQQDGVLAKVLAPLFDVLLYTSGQLPARITSYYDLHYHSRTAGELSDLAGPQTLDGKTIPGYLILVGR